MRFPLEYILQGVLVVLVFLIFAGWSLLARILLVQRGPGFTIVGQGVVFSAIIALWFSPRFILFFWRLNDLRRLARLEAGASLCARCGYSRDNLPDDRVCPECGKPFETVIDVRRRVYGIAQAVPGLEQVPSSEVAAALRRLLFVDRMLSWTRMAGVAAALLVITILITLAFEIVYEVTRLDLPRSVKLLPSIAVPLVFVFSLVWMKIGHIERGLHRFVRDRALHMALSAPEH